MYRDTYTYMYKRLTLHMTYRKQLKAAETMY